MILYDQLQDIVTRHQSAGVGTIAIESLQKLLDRPQNFDHHSALDRTRDLVAKRGEANEDPVALLEEIARTLDPSLNVGNRVTVDSPILRGGWHPSHGHSGVVVPAPRGTEYLRGAVWVVLDGQAGPPQAFDPMHLHAEVVAE